MRAAERIGFTLYVLLAVFLVGREMVGKVAGVATVAPSPTIAATATPSAPTSTSPAAITASPSVAPTATPSPSPEPTPQPLVATPYQNGSRRYAALSVPVGYLVTSPVSGTAKVVVYQFLEQDIRVGSNIPSEPFFPYITITAADRTVILRPGALGRDVQLVVKDGQAVAVGTPLFTVVGDGASSWRTFYDRRVTAQVIASVTARPSGLDLDPVALFAR